jgi:hypothetical protein
VSNEQRHRLEEIRSNIINAENLYPHQNIDQHPHLPAQLLETALLHHHDVSSTGNNNNGNNIETNSDEQIHNLDEVNGKELLPMPTEEDVKNGKLNFENLQDGIDYIRRINHVNGYGIVKGRQKKDKDIVIHQELKCQHFGLPRIDDKEKRRNMKSKKTGCPWYLYFGYSKREGSYHVNSHNFQHTCEQQWKTEPEPQHSYQSSDSPMQLMYMSETLLANLSRPMENTDVTRDRLHAIIHALVSISERSSLMREIVITKLQHCLNELQGSMLIDSFQQSPMTRKRKHENDNVSEDKQKEQKVEP